MSLSDSERTTLSLLLRSLSGDVVAIDTLFGVSGGTPPANAAERTSQQNLLKALAGQQVGIDALFGLTPDGSGNLSTAERAAVDNLLRALSGDAAALDALSFGAPYSFATDPKLLARWRADNGLADMAKGFFGALAPRAGAVPVVTGSNGQQVWQFVKGSGNVLSSLLGPVSTPVQQLIGPFTIIVIGKFTGTPAVNDTMFYGSNNVAAIGTWFAYFTAAKVALKNGPTLQIAATPAAYQVYTLYNHANETRYSVNGAAYSAKQVGGAAGVLNGVTLGSAADGTSDCSCEIEEILVYAGEGGPSAAFWTSFDAYQHVRNAAAWPATSLMVPFSVDTASLGGLFSAPFDIWLAYGQSNLEVRATATTGTPTGSVWNHFKDNTIGALTATYDKAAVDANTLDRVSASGSAGVGGPMVPFMNAYMAASGRPAILIPAMLGGSGYPNNGDNVVSVAADWTPGYPAGTPTRCGLTGSAIARTKSLQALGGTLRGAIWYDGEAAATGSGSAASLYQASAKATMDAIANAVGVDRFIIQQIYSSLTGGTGPNIATVQAGQAALGVAGSRLVSSPPTSGKEADGIHNTAASCIEIAARWMSLITAQGAPWI